MQDFENYKADYLMQDSSSVHLFERVLYTLRQEKMGAEEISSMPGALALPFFDVLRYARLHLQDI